MSSSSSILLLSLAVASSCDALVIRTYNAARHDRYLDFPSAPRQNPTFLNSAVDLSGVGWYQQEVRRQFSLVSPRHFIGANHFKPSTSGFLSFLSKDDVVRTFAIASIQTIANAAGDPSDLFIGTLGSEIQPEDGINFQPFLSVPASQVVGQTLIITGHLPGASPTHRAGRGVINARTQFGDGSTTEALTGGPINNTEAFTWTYQEIPVGTGTTNDDAHVQPGDSGSPSLVNVNNRGAIVGTHLALLTVGLSGARQYTNVDTFVPFYVDKLNAVMAPSGYHMTRAVPGPSQPSAPLTVTPAPVMLLRAGYPATLGLAVRNSGLSDAANNLKLSLTLPISTTPASAVGTGWVTSGTAPSVRVRKGGLDPVTTSSLSVSFTPAEPGLFSSTITFSADESPQADQTLDLEVIESFRSWSRGLADRTVTADDDHDSLSNLLEYAFGGDPTLNSSTHPADESPLRPFLEESGEDVSYSFLRRTDAVARGLAYEVQSSPDLSSGSFVPTTVVTSESDPVAAGFERITVTLPRNGERRFYRLALTLSE